MNFTKSQKKLIKKNFKRLPLSEISSKAGISEKDLRDYLKSFLPEEKFRKYVLAHPEQREIASASQKQLSWPGFKNWIKQNYLAIILLTLLAAAVYTNALGNEFLSDDIAGIMQEKNIGNPLYWLVHQPINFFRYLNFGIIYNLFGLKPPFFRLVNILLHIGSILTLFAIITIIYNQQLALFASGIFAVHPLLSEAVTWISGGIHAQYSFFTLLSFFLYLLARFHNWSKKYYWLSLASFFVALFTTEKSAILPLIIVSFEFSFGQLSQTWKKTIPYFALSSLAAAFVLLGGNFSSRIFALRTQYYQDAGLYNPFTQIPTAIASYLWLFIWPDKLTLYHSEMSFSKFQFFLMFSLTLTFLSLLIITSLKKRSRQYFFWLSFFIISLLPMLTPFKVAWIVAERYVYLGIIGIIVLTGLGFSKIGEISKSKYLAWGIWGAIIIALSARTIVRNVDWKNQDNLWLAAARTSPSSPQNHNNLGDLYSRHGNLAKAAEEFQFAIKLKPDYGDAYHNLANVYRQMGKNDLAEENYQNALRFNQKLWQSYQNLAVIYFEKAEYQLSLEMVQKATEINPQNPDLYLIAAVNYLRLGDKQKTSEQVQKALALDPNNQKAKDMLNSLK